MRRVEDVLDCWFDSGSMPFAQVHYPFENAGVVRGPFPGRLRRGVRGPDQGLVLHAARAGERIVRQAGVLQLHGARYRARPRQAEALQAPAELPGPRRDAGPFTGPTQCAGSFCRRRSCAAATSWSSEKAMAEAVRAVINPLWNSWKFFAMYANADRYQAQLARPTPLRCSTATSCPRHASLVEEVDSSDGPLRPVRGRAAQ